MTSDSTLASVVVRPPGRGRLPNPGRPNRLLDFSVDASGAAVVLGDDDDLKRLPPGRLLRNLLIVYKVHIC